MIPQNHSPKYLRSSYSLLGILQGIHKHSARPVKIPAFWGAMEHLGFTGREGRAVLAHLSARMYMLVFPDEDGHVAGISLVPQQYRCWQCNGLLNMQDDIRLHFDDCRKRQAKPSGLTTPLLH